MKILKLNAAFALILCCFSLVCQASNINDPLYTGVVSAKSEQVSDREQAMQQALKQVLIKLNGNSNTIAKLTLPTPAQASQWAQQYRYDGTALAVTFDQKAVNRYLQQNNIAIWNADRPLTLVWIAVEENGVQAIVGENELGLSHWQQLFMQDSQMRAVSVLFPLLDLTDKQQVELNDVWYHVAESLQPAALRYQTENTLSGRIYYNNQTSLWSSDWMLALPAEQINWQVEAGTQEELIKATVDRFVNELAARASNTTTPAQAASVVLEIDNIRDINSYLRVMSYLQSLNAIDTITPKKMMPTAVSLRLKLTGPVASLEQELSASQMLQPLSSTRENVLHYQYL